MSAPVAEPCSGSPSRVHGALGQTGVVTVLQPDGSHKQVQVVSGLEGGQQIVLAQGE